MIYYSIPYSTTKKIGKYYNDFMRILPNDEDFGCFVDGDTIFTTVNYGHILDAVVKEYPNIGCFTALTNRVACPWQIAKGVDINNNDMQYHRNFGKNLQEIYGTHSIDVTNVPKNMLMSGFLILLQKRVWKKTGGFIETGMLGVDNDFHAKIQSHREKMYMMTGVYLYHWYRWPNITNTEHLK